MERAIKQTKDEIDAMAKAHTDLASLYKKYEADVNEFTVRREGVRKGVSRSRSPLGWIVRGES